MAVVIVSNLKSFQAETAIDRPGYLIVRRFEFTPLTTCELNGQSITPKEALEGSLGGWYECRLMKSDQSVAKSQTSHYAKDHTTFQLAVVASALLVIAGFSLGDK